MPDFKDFKKGAITTNVVVAFFFATCYPTGEGEQGILKIADTRYLPCEVSQPQNIVVGGARGAMPLP